VAFNYKNLNLLCGAKGRNIWLYNAEEIDLATIFALDYIPKGSFAELGFNVLDPIIIVNSTTGESTWGYFAKYLETYFINYLPEVSPPG